MTVATVDGMWRHPVKGFTPEPVAEAILCEGGFFPFDRLYALDKPTRQNVTLQYLCNQVIHSYIFLLLFDEDGKLAGVFVVSDFHRFKKLFQISLQTIVDIFNRIGNDDIARMRLVFDPLKGDYRTYAQ